ncbi:glycosyl hydrolase 115 family protein [Paraflavisolibacter sp. H34]|uniref:glycosyl hydrolase 115 family protein n=1 Tax=Huijunlia imazamoxiresistens TaxID=3127457 RepID=UPI0030170854
MKKWTCLLLGFLFLTHALPAQKATMGALTILDKPTAGTFPLAGQNAAPTILVDASDAAVVRIAANALAGDIALVTGTRPKVITDLKQYKGSLVIAGTIGQSPTIDGLIRAKKLDVSKIKGKWETFTLSTINTPLKGVQQALVIAGSDRRGTAYGLFELSRRAGVSPWVWWADVLPQKRKALYVRPGTFSSAEPSVKYRGLFINDEDWGLNPWARKNMDTAIRDMGPKTYAHLFELLLRLRANVIWPAMHDSTKAFWYYPDNPKVADQYAIVIGSTHCDMMLRSNTFEWQKNFEHEYGVQPGTYRYDSNKTQIYKYWEDRVAAAKNYEAMYTVGMRGVRDGTIVGPTTREGKIALTETIIQDQRGLFQRYFGGPTNALQIFCPYKEVLGLYQGRLKVPEDVTLVWTDDNFGYIRQLSTPAEQKRSGASGIYYHLSYLGGPHDYLWLSTTSPALISYEMTKGYQFGANRFWVVNVGDLKPAELETQFFLDLAWNINLWTPEKAHTYARHWAEQTFGKELAAPIAALKSEYYRLAQQGKPEHMGILRFDSASRRERLAAYDRLLEQVEAVKARLPERLKNAFFELVEYPAKGAALMNQKILFAQMSREVPAGDRPLAVDLSQKAKNAFDRIRALTAHYNTGIEGGKWNGIITYKPRNLSVYGMPEVAAPEILEDSLRSPKVYDRRYLDTTSVAAALKPGIVSLPATGFFAKHETKGERIAALTGLGLNGTSISRYPFTGASFTNEEAGKAPYVEYKVSLPAGTYRLSLKCLPTQAIHKGRKLGLAVSVDNGPLQFVNVAHPEEDRVWKANLLRGYSEGTVPLQIRAGDPQILRVYLLDTGLAFSRLDVAAE